MSPRLFDEETIVISGGAGSAVVAWRPGDRDEQGQIGVTASVPTYGPAYTADLGVTASHQESVEIIVDLLVTPQMALAIALLADLGVTASHAEAVEYLTDLGVTASHAEAVQLLADLGVTAGGFFSLVDYLDWANANVRSIGWTNPADAIDKSTTTRATATAAASGVGGVTNVTLNFDLQQSFPDFVAPFTNFTVTAIVWEYQWKTETAGTQVTAGTVNAQVVFSAFEGATYYQQEVITNPVIDPGPKSVDMLAFFDLRQDTPDASSSDNDGYIVGAPHPSLITSPWGGGTWGSAFDIGNGTEVGGSSPGIISKKEISGGTGRGAFSLECKVRRDRLGVAETIMGWVDLTDTAKYLCAVYFWTDDKVYAEFFNAAGASLGGCISASTVATGNHDVALTWDGTNARLYIDGTLSNTAAISAAAWGAARSSRVAVGRYPGYGNSFPLDGAIDEFRMSSTARYTGASYTVASAPFTDDANTLVLWHLDQVDVPNIWTRISEWRTRIFGSLTSGTGLGKTETLSWYYSRLRIQATGPAF